MDIRTPSEIRALSEEGTARLRDGQAGGCPVEFVQKLRAQLQRNVPHDMALSIFARLAALEAFEERRAVTGVAMQAENTTLSLAISSECPSVPGCIL